MKNKLLTLLKTKAFIISASAVVVAGAIGVGIVLTAPKEEVLEVVENVTEESVESEVETSEIESEVEELIEEVLESEEVIETEETEETEESEELEETETDVDIEESETEETEVETSEIESEVVETEMEVEVVEVVEEVVEVVEESTETTTASTSTDSTATTPTVTEPVVTEPAVTEPTVTEPTVTTPDPATCSHNWVQTLSNYAATCIMAGTNSYKCSICGEGKNETGTALGHSFGSWTTITTPTCSTGGMQQRVCSSCSYTEFESIAATGNHNYSNSKEISNGWTNTYDDDGNYTGKIETYTTVYYCDCGAEK